MLTIRVGADAGFDEEESKFVDLGGTVLHLEHSLLSLSKWESQFEKPFLGKDEKTAAEVLEYIKCMNLDPETPPEVFAQLSQDNLDEINVYLNASQSATWFNEAPGAPQTQREVITSELIYYWLTVFRIPFVPTESWNLNRLFTLVRICNLKQEKPKKMSRSEVGRRHREINEQRKKQLGTSG